MAPTTQSNCNSPAACPGWAPETAFEVLNKARALERQGKSINPLEIGEPDFDTPANVIEAAVDALHHGWTHYGRPQACPNFARPSPTMSAALAESESHRGSGRRSRR